MSQSSNPSALAELKALQQWVCWRYETRGSGKATKPPYQPTGEAASTTDETTWWRYDAVVKAAVKFSGIGFVVGEHDPYCGVDLDGCLEEDGSVADWARGIVDRLNSYTERTPSGNGLRVWVRGRITRGRKKSLGEGKGIEVYDRGRFFTVTGEQYPGTPDRILPRQDALDWLIENLFPSEEGIAKKEAPSSLSLSDHEVVTRAQAATNGARFRALFAGDWRGAGYKSQSEADLALCNDLRFWTGGDPVQMDRLFRQSGLMREKWDEKHGQETYGDKTLALAMAGGPNVYTGANGALPPRVREIPPSPPGAPFPIHNTDWGNAMRLVRRHGADLRYCHALGWLVWDLSRWKPDAKSEIVARAKETVASIYGEAATLEDGERKALAKHALDSEKVARIHAMIELAKSEPEVIREAHEFDRDPFLLTCSNGTLDLTTGVLREHRREDMLTKMTPIDYDPEAKCPRWERFLAEVFAGDVERIGYVSRAVGYSLTADVREHCFFFLTGVGANGKSTFLNILSTLVGEYAMFASRGLLTENKHQEHSTVLADLAGRRMILSSEIGEGKRFNEELVKVLTGDEPIRARKIGQNSFEFPPLYKVWLAANHKPEVRGTDHGWWRRIHTIPFDVTFYDPGQGPSSAPLKDPGLKSALMAEIPGILAWAVKGCLEWARGGLRVPAVVRETTNSYREEMDTLGGFIADCCVVGGGLWAKSGDLYAAYQEWCGRNGEHAVTQTAFGRRLVERGFTQERERTHGRLYRGIGIVVSKADPRLIEE